MSVEEVRRCLDNATATLVEAQEMCHAIYVRINEKKRELAHWQGQTATLRFLVDCIGKQCRFLQAGVLQRAVGQSLIEGAWRAEAILELHDEMDQWQARIDSQVLALSTVKNVLVKPGDSLSNYITLGNVELLRRRLAELPDIRRHIANIKTQYSDMVRRVDERLVRSKLEELTSMMDSHFRRDDPQLVMLLERAPNDLIHFEDDLVEILNSLTDHFDKSNILMNHSTGMYHSTALTSSGAQSSTSEAPAFTDFQELWGIVKQDDAELHSVMETLTDNVCDIETYLKEVDDVIIQKTQHKAQLHQRLKKFIVDLEKYSEYLNIFQEIAKLIAAFKQSCRDDIEMTKSLCQFYQHFQHSYEELLVEVQRRRQVSQRMQQILDDCESQLQRLQREDLAARTNFLNQNGNYLPENIWPSAIDDTSPIYSLQYSIKKI